MLAEVNKTLQRLMSSKEFALIIASNSVRYALSEGFRESVEASIEPLVLFMPAFEGNIQEESISSLARRGTGNQYSDGLNDYMVESLVSRISGPRSSGNGA